jgi:hypothetical protein
MIFSMSYSDRAKIGGTIKKNSITASKKTEAIFFIIYSPLRLSPPVLDLTARKGRFLVKMICPAAHIPKRPKAGIPYRSRKPLAV